MLTLNLEDSCRVNIYYGGKHWYLNNKYHRLDGPAVEYAYWARWYQNGKLHRDDGPAVEYPSGTKLWYQNGGRHRLDGPAIECADGGKEWWTNGKPWVAPEGR